LVRASKLYVYKYSTRKYFPGKHYGVGGLIIILAIVPEVGTFTQLPKHDRTFFQIIIHLSGLSVFQNVFNICIKNDESDFVNISTNSFMQSCTEAVASCLDASECFDIIRENSYTHIQILMCLQGTINITPWTLLSISFSWLLIGYNFSGYWLILKKHVIDFEGPMRICNIIVNRRILWGSFFSLDAMHRILAFSFVVEYLWRHIHRLAGLAWWFLNAILEGLLFSNAASVANTMIFTVMPVYIPFTVWTVLTVGTSIVKIEMGIRYAVNTALGIFIVTQTSDLTIFHCIFFVCTLVYPLITIAVWPSNDLLYSQPLFPEMMVGKCPVSSKTFYHISTLPENSFRRRLFCDMFHKYRLYKPHLLPTMVLGTTIPDSEDLDEQQV